MGGVAIRNLKDLSDYLRQIDGRVLINMFQATGHILSEIDNFLRMRQIGEIDPARPYILVFPDGDFGRGIASVYGHLFHAVLVGNYWFDMVREIALYAPELTVDVGVSHLKIIAPPDRKTCLFPWNNRFWHMMSRDDWTDLTVQHYRRRRLTRDFYPMMHDRPLPEALEAAIGRTERMALIHLKVHTINATAAPTDPSTYLGALSVLRDQGFRLVFVGREPMPDLFRQFDIYDYANSGLASFENDLLLFRRASFALLAGSGISYLAEIFDVPFIYANYWHIWFAQYSKRSVNIPILMRRRSDGHLLRFEEHFALMQAFPEFGFMNFPTQAFDAIPADRETLADATHEVLSLSGPDSPPLHPLQERFNALDPLGCSGYLESRVSRYFLEKHADLL